MPHHFAETVISESSSLRTAMEVMDRGSLEIVLVVDADGTLLGTVTDGDIRRAILSGASLGDGVSGFMQRRFTAVGPSASRAEVLDLMRARSLQQIPIVDEAGRLAGLHLLREILGASVRPNWAVVMAGGRGERLRPITDALPKPMIKVAGRPILERIVLHLVGFGIRRIFLSVNYMGDVIEGHFGNGADLGCRIEYLKEGKPLGTGGALSLLGEKPDHPFLMLNGDLLTQFNVGNMLAFHTEGEFKATVGVHEYIHTVPYGVVERDGDRVTGIREKPTQTWLANAGIYVFHPDLVERVPKDTYYPLPALVEECLDRGEPVGTFPIKEEWIDVGHPTELRRARGEGEKT
ncbi:MAG: CBS domain-containing protein [Deltaproteobacteria bacterium]|nr:MAG: CBS domain-containing protein [Deltaproteobacteria bacterium]